MSASPVSPSLKDLPKVNNDLKSQLECFNQRNLKDVNTLEKNILPSAQDVAAEKTQRALLEGVEGFDTSKLKHTETNEKNPLPDKDVVYQEKVHQKLFNGVECFDKATMKHAETQEKNPLPDRQVIEFEKDKMKFITGIESFDPAKLKHTETLEKNPLPTKEMKVKIITFSVLFLCLCTVEGEFINNATIPKNYNPCCSIPCLHTGICTPLSAIHYECNCPAGYYGKTCEKSTFSQWVIDKLKLYRDKRQQFIMTGRLFWGIVNNIPILHDTALRHFYLSGSGLRDFENRLWDYSKGYTPLDVYYNLSFIDRGLPPVPPECPTPVGVKGHQVLPEVNKLFELLFQRTEFKPCPLGTNLMFATFAQYLGFQFFKSDLSDGFHFEPKRSADVFSIYGSNEATRKALRSHINGKLKVRIINGEEYPPYLEDVPEVPMHYPSDSKSGKSVFPKWAMDHEMLNITPMMFAMATIWLREHNRVCDILVKEHPDWGDERLYQSARGIIVGELLTITVGEYLQHLAQYRLKLGYKPHLFHNTAISSSKQMQYEFSLAFQWPQMMPDFFTVHGKRYNLMNLTFSNNRIVFKHGLDAIVDSMSRNPAGQITYRNCGKAFENMMKLLIEEGRKSRLHSFNEYRRFYNLKPYETFLELVGNKEVADILQELYKDVDAVEFVVGIFVEKPARSVLPPTMIFLGGPIALREILRNPIGSYALWRPSTFGGKIGFDIVQRATLRKLFCLNLKGNCKNNVWVSFRTPSDITIISKRISRGLSKNKK